MKKLFVLLLLAVSSFITFAQTPLGFSYDAAGNRTSRYIINTSQNSLKETNNTEPVEYSIEGDTKVLLYPNPTSGLLSMEIKLPETSNECNILVKIYTNTGALILNKRLDSQSFTVDISEQVSGTYFMDIYINDRKQLFTIIKK